MEDIKIGDKVICTDNSGYKDRLTIDNEYTIVDIFKSPIDNYQEYFIDVINDIGEYSSPKLSRFKIK